MFSVIRADVPGLLTLIETPPAGAVVWNAEIRKAWGDFDFGRADILKQWNKFLNIYIRANGDSKDHSGIGFDLRFFSLICDDRKISCFGTWHDAGDHGISKAGINLPFTEDYPSPDSQPRMDRPLPVFTHSTANRIAAIGWYNLGLEWGSAGITKIGDTLTIPIRYRQHTNIGPDIPDQPESATFDLTIRRSGFRPGFLLSYQIGSRTGHVTVDQTGDVSIPQVTLGSGPVYTNVVLTDTKTTRP